MGDVFGFQKRFYVEAEKMAATDFFIEMFYSYDIVGRRGARFYIPWFAAIKIQKLSRKELLSVDICKMCDDIMNWIPTNRTGAGAAHTKFSLYMCAQLMKGMVVIYAKQQEFLLLDLQHAQKILQMPVVSCGIDMPTESSDKRHKRRVNIDVVERQITEDYFALPAADFGRITFDFTSPTAELKRNKEATAVELGAEDAFSTHTSSLLRALVGEEVTDEKLKALHIAHPREITLREDLALTRDFGFPLEEAFPADERALEDLEALLALPPSQQIITTEIMDRTVPGEATIELAPAERMERTAVGPVVQPTILEEPAAPAKRARLENVDQVDVTAAVAPPALEPQPEMVEVAIALTPVQPEGIKAKRRIGAVRRKKIILDEKIKFTPEEFSVQIKRTEDTLLPDDQIIVNIEAAKRELDKKRHFWREPAFAMSKSLMEIFRANTEPVEPESYDINRIFTTPPWTVYSEKSVSEEEVALRFDDLTLAAVQPPPQEMIEEEMAPPPEHTLVPPQEVSEVSSKELSREYQEDRRISLKDLSAKSRPTAALPETSGQLLPLAEMIEEPMGDEEARRSTETLEEPCRESPPTVADMPFASPKTFELRSSDLFEIIKEKTTGNRIVSFEELVPLSMTKAVAGKTFYIMLSLMKNRKIVAKQDEPYGEISISRQKKQR